METKITTLKNTDYVPDFVEIINANTQALKDAVDALYNALGITLTDDGKAIIGDGNYVSAVNVGEIKVKVNGGIQMYSSKDESNLVAYISVNDDTNKSEAKFDKVTVGELVSDSKAVMKSFVPITNIDSPIAFDSSNSDYIVDVPEETTGAIQLEVSFDECINGQEVNLMIGALNGASISLISIKGDFEFANGYDTEPTVLSTIYYGSTDDYANQIKFLVREINGKNKIIVLK